jgi:hypothetical protein
MTSYNIRGKLGMQIFESFAAISKSFDVEGMISGHRPVNLDVNIGGDSGRRDENHSNGFRNRLNDLFILNDIITVTEVFGFGKQNVWSGDQMRHAFENRAKIATLFKIDISIIQPSQPWQNVLHIRGLDKQVATASSYGKAAMQFARSPGSNVIVGDDPKMIGGVVLQLELNKSLFDDIQYQVSSENDVIDWLTVLYADQVWGPMSSFTLSTLLFNPDKKINILHRDINNGSYLLTDDNYRAVEVIMGFCKNVKWIN